MTCAPMTMAEKILARAGGKECAKAGEIVSGKVDRTMSHDNAGLVSKVFRSIGVEHVFDPDKIVLLLDHRVPANSIKTAEGHKSVREFVKEYKMPHFLDMREGICHQVMVEMGFVAPGMLVVGTDSHTTTYGALGASSTGIGATEMATVWATGELWLRVPDTMKITVTGSFPEGVYAKDLILYIIGQLRSDGADYRSVEFYGECVEGMSVSERMTICNMAMEMGAKAAMVPPDEKAFAYAEEAGVPRDSYTPVYADEGAVYEKELVIDASLLVPQVACPHKVDNVKPLSEVAGTKFDQAVIGSCTNGRLDDLAIGASFLKNKEVHHDVRLIVIPASRRVYLEAIEAGHIATYLKAGATIINPGCGPCLGAHQGIMAEGEKCIATTNRNFKGRMGSTESEVYLASPAAVAASAVAGKFTDPREVSA